MGCGWAGGDAYPDILSLYPCFCMTTRTERAAMRKRKERKKHDSLALVNICK
jgi:hypothetical protein